MASVAKREWTHKGETKTAWVVRYTDEGGKRRMKTFEKKKDADRYRMQVEGEICAGIHTPSHGAITLAELVNLWVRDQQRRNVIGEITGATLYGYTMKAQRMIARHPIGRTNVTTLTSLQIQQFIDERSVEWSRGTCTELRMIMRYVLTFAVRRKILKRNILVDEPVSVPKSKKKKTLITSTDDLKSLFAAAITREEKEPLIIHYNRLLVLCLGVFAGLRGGEMMGLQWGDINFETSTLHIRHSLSAHDGLKSPKSEAGERDVPLARPIREALLQVADYWSTYERVLGSAKRVYGHSRAMSLIREEVEARGVRDALPQIEGFVLRNKNGGPVEPTNLNAQYFRPLLRRAGLAGDGAPRLHLHLLRHAAVSLYIRAGTPPLQLKRLVGHASIKTTFDVYGHLFDDDDIVRQASASVVSHLDVPLLATHHATRAQQQP